MILVILWASILAPSVYGQWTQVYSLTGGFNGICFTDSLNGWFTHQGTDKIIHTSDGGYNFDVQSVTPGQYTLYDVYMKDQLNGWSAGEGISGGPGIIHHTTNGGVTWVQMTHPAPNNSGWGCIVGFNNNIWFGGAYGTNQGIIMKTSDSGQNWEVILYPNFGIIVGITVFDQNNYIINGYPGLLSRTTDNGTSWISVNFPSDYSVEKVVFSDQNVGYALVSTPYSSPPDAYLYKTSDSGFTWNLIYSWVDQGQKRGLSVIPGSSTIFIGGYLSQAPYLSGLLKSTDSGETWDIVMTGTFGPSQILSPNLYYGWAAAGIYIYRYDYVTPPTVEPITNKLIQFGQSFTYQVNAIGLGLKYSMTGNPSGLSIGMYSGLIDGIPTQGGKFDITVAVKDTDANVVNEEFRLKVNRKPHFLEPFPPLVAYVDSMYQVALVVEDLDDDTLSFSALQKPAFLELIPNPPSPNYTATILGTPAITDTGYHNISITVSDGYGGADTLNWTLQVIKFIPPVNHPPEFIGNWSDTVYVFRDSSYTWNFDFQDIDGDTIWTIDENIGVPGMNTEPNIGIGVVTLTATGIPADTGRYSAMVKVRDEHDSIGVVQFIVVVDVITGIDNMSSPPSEFVLYQNYPNSFNPSTKIKYSIPELSFVTLKIYDVLGNEITTLVNEEKAVGTYEVNWTATNLPSGVYFYKLQAISAAGGFIDTKKMILMK